MRGMWSAVRFGPIPGDKARPAVVAAIGQIGTSHLLPQSVTTFAVEAWKDDGTDHQPMVVLELEGRFNRTDDPGALKAAMALPVALMLLETLAHSVQTLLDATA